jgi:hypothetical protein
MSIVFDAPVSNEAITEFIRNVPTPQSQVLNQLLPDDFVEDNEVELMEIQITNRTARYRAFDGRIHVSARDLASTKKVKLPPLSSSLSKGELERLNIQFAQNGGGAPSRLVTAIYNDAASLTREIQARMELARGDVLTDGKFTLAGEGGMYMEVDYGVPLSHFVTPGILWSSTSTATIVTNLTSMRDQYITTNGFAPGGMTTSTRVLGYMLSNAEFRTLAATMAGTPGLVTRQGVDAVLNAFSLPPIKLVYDTKVDVDGVSTPVIPDNKVIFTPPNAADLGQTKWGVTATALELVNSSAVDFSFSDAPGIVGVIIKDGPPFREFTFADAVGMPALNNAKLLMVATVA